MSTKKYPEKLTRENFWNKLYEESHGEVQHFCDWIDEYKQKVNWNYLFSPNIKFHHLPIGMQIGIVFQYFEETAMNAPWGEVIDPTDFPQIMEFIREEFIQRYLDARDEHFRGKYLEDYSEGDILP